MTINNDIGKSSLQRIASLTLNLGKGEKPVLPSLDESLAFLKNRKDIESKLKFFLGNMESEINHKTGNLEEDVILQNRIKMTNITKCVPLSILNKSNFVTNSSIVTAYFAGNGTLGQMLNMCNSTDLQSTVRVYSVFMALPPYLKNAYCNIPGSIRESGMKAISNWLKIKAIKHYLKDWSVSDPMLNQNTDTYHEFDLMCNTAYNKFIAEHKQTLNPLIYTNIATGENVWIDGLAALQVIAEHQVSSVDRVIRRLKDWRKKKNAILKESANIRNMANSGMTLEKVQFQLSEIRPTSWETPHYGNSLSPTLGMFAKNKYPKGSLVGIEIEFVGNCRSPLSPGNSEPCNDCEACNNEDWDNCENSVDQSEWLHKPFLWFKGDGSVSATKGSQVLLGYQEMNLCCNITDPRDSMRIDDTLEWMNSQKCEVNKSCGLHIHLDSRHMTVNKFTRKANKMDEAMKNWIQFTVPFSRVSNSYCRVFDDNTRNRYKAVNRTAFQKFSTLEIRIGSASLNVGKVKCWAKLLHYVFNTKEDCSTIQGVLKSDMSPELKAFAISRICHFYESHLKGRTSGNDESCGEFVNKGTPQNQIPKDIVDIYNTWNNVIKVDGGNI